MTDSPNVTENTTIQITLKQFTIVFVKYIILNNFCGDLISGYLMSKWP